ncbi:MAG: ComEA family DNA-binding protein [bacterium]
MKNLPVIVSGILILALLLSLPGIYFYTEGNSDESTGGIQRINPSFGVVEREKVQMPRSDELPETDFSLKELTRSELEKVRHRLKIDINTASAENLERISGVGPTTANAIIQYREQHGKFNNIDELTNVSGIGPATIETMRNQVKVGGETPRRATKNSAPQRSTPARSSRQAESSESSKINVNTASEQELTRITGVGPATAKKIIAYREQQGRIKDENDLQNVSGIGPATASKMAGQITF